ncbi:hypothetical protein B9G55_04360 [Saccharibacillus sp. O16]|nr:hypothetical protein B9G55_04360 [Saccharibacillus sp. O16]
MKKLSVLSLRKQTRKGYPCDFDYAEFLIDGQPLMETVRKQYPHLDDIGCLGWGTEEVQCGNQNRLLLIGEADFPHNRRSLYICPACGDLGCGAVSIRIERANGCFIWQEFGVQSVEDSRNSLTLLNGIGPFYFAEDAYRDTICSAYGLGGFRQPAITDE